MSKSFTTTIPGMSGDPSMVAKIGNGVQTATYNFVVKYYGDTGTGAVTIRTADWEHWFSAVGYTLRANVNVPIAQKFFEATKDMECKKE